MKSIYDLLGDVLNRNDYGAITLGQLIDSLATVDPERVVLDGFGAPDSWRGVYAFLRFEPVHSATVRDMLAYARGAVGVTYTGYKGGEFTMTRDTPVFIDGYGECADDAAITAERLKKMLGVDVAEHKESNMPKRPASVEMYQMHGEVWGIVMPHRNWKLLQEYVDELRVLSKYPLKVDMEVQTLYNGTVFIVDEAWDAYKEHINKLEEIAAKIDDAE